MKLINFFSNIKVPNFLLLSIVFEKKRHSIFGIVKFGVLFKQYN